MTGIINSIGIIKESRSDESRAPIAPSQVLQILEQNPGINIFVQPCDIRTFKDEEYEKCGAKIKNLNLLRYDNECFFKASEEKIKISPLNLDKILPAISTESPNLISGYEYGPNLAICTLHKYVKQPPAPQPARLL